ncbi:hypothetical protein [Mycobacterium sp. 94-17]|uniref:hypothetical protein n=1 Tax=Mycobacterium sp. 94-17 TaxID=2986147 RepID=UPI002D1E6E13|nr:hypothetical protein [Mycobacterium sp. 94-17]MEB4210200.1 hypothetical protein [Mycobacterium sp. 94-17]
MPRTPVGLRRDRGPGRVSSAFTLAKVIRDQQEAVTVRVRLDEARIEKLLADCDPPHAAD